MPHGGKAVPTSPRSPSTPPPSGRRHRPSRTGRHRQEAMAAEQCRTQCRRRMREAVAHRYVGHEPTARTLAPALIDRTRHEHRRQRRTQNPQIQSNRESAMPTIARHRARQTGSSRVAPTPGSDHRQEHHAGQPDRSLPSAQRTTRLPADAARAPLSQAPNSRRPPTVWLLSVTEKLVSSVADASASTVRCRTEARSG